jgi:hypothetical protein
VGSWRQVIDLAKDFKIPGADLEGFYYLRDVVDADKLVAAMAELKKTDGKARIFSHGLGTASGKFSVRCRMHGQDQRQQHDHDCVQL